MVMFIDSDNVVIYYPKIWFAVIQYHIWILLCVGNKWHWWDANQNMLWEYYLSTLICQNYKTREKSKIILWLGKYPIGKVCGCGNIRLGKCLLGEVSVGKCLVGELSSRGSVGRVSIPREYSFRKLFYNPLHISYLHKMQLRIWGRGQGGVSPHPWRVQGRALVEVRGTFKYTKF